MKTRGVKVNKTIIWLDNNSKTDKIDQLKLLFETNSDNNNLSLRQQHCNC